MRARARADALSSQRAPVGTCTIQGEGQAERADQAEMRSRLPGKQRAGCGI